MEAVAILKMCVEKYPESEIAYYYYADALRENNEIEKAIKNYKKSLEINPNNSNAIQNLKKLGFDLEN